MWIDTLRIVIRRLFRRNAVEEELHDELRAYLEHDVEQKILDGMPPADARRSALMEMGGLEQVKERVRTSRREAWLDSLIADCRYALRALRRRPAFTGIAVLTVTLGIGAAASMFAVVDNVLLRPLKYRDSDRLVTVWGVVGALKDAVAAAPWNRFTVSEEDYEDWRHRQTAFEETALFATNHFRFTGDDQTRTIPGGRVSANFFSMLGTQLFQGGPFTEGHYDEVVVTHEFWATALGSDPNAIRRKITVGQTTRTIVGVLPRGFNFAGHGANDGPNPQIWQIARVTDRSAPDFEIIGRLRSGIPLADAERESDAIFRDLRFAFLNDLPALEKRHGARLERRIDVETIAARTPLLILLLASGLLLLIACGNVANLLLGEARGREHEVAMRSALGASALRIVRQLIIESILLAVMGGILGSGLAWFGVRGLVRLAPPGLPRISEITVDLRILLVVIAAAAATGILFGLAPAIGLTRTDLVETLKNRAQHRGSSRSRSQNAVVIAEIAICFLLLVGAGLLVQSLMRLSSTDPGFEPARLIEAEVSLPPNAYQGPALLSLYRQMFRGLSALPGVTGVTGASAAPFREFRSVSPLTIDGKPTVIETRAIWPNYFDVVGGRVIDGRSFAENETGDYSVIVINKSMAGKYWPNQSAVDKRVEFVARKSAVIGVTDDVRQLGLGVSAPPMYYATMNEDTSFTILLRTSQSVANIAPAIRNRIRLIDKNIAIDKIESMDALMRASFLQERYRTLLISIFALSAATLALIGLYGVISRFVAYRNRELGIRIAIGAIPRNVLALVLRKGLFLAVCGIALGWLAAAVLTRALSEYLFGISALDATTYAGVAIVLTAVSLLAAYVPARRASRIDPMKCLRTE